MTAQDQNRARRNAERNRAYAAEAERHTMAELLDVWGIPLAGVIARCYSLRTGGFLKVIPAKPPNPAVQAPERVRPAADLDSWMTALDGTKTSAEVSALWGVAVDTFQRRIRRLRDAGYHPEWASPPRRERAERKPVARLPPLWPRESTPAIAPAPITEEPEHPKPAPYVGIANPPSRWTALGVRNVLDVPWRAFEAGVRVAFGWTLQPHTLLTDEDATSILTLFGVAVRSAA
jgi:hypothetical protein